MEGKLSYWIEEMTKQGISNDHIKDMKDRILISESDYHLYYDEINNNKLPTPTLVDVSRIQGTSNAWVTENRSIYELFFSVTREISTNCKKSLNSERIQENVDSLINNGLKYQYKFYIDHSIEYKLRDGLPKFNYYMDDDMYFSNATHRTVSAIMFNAPSMVGYVFNYKKNSRKFKNYLLNKETNNQWNSFLDSLSNLTIKETKQNNRIEEYKIQLKEYPTAIHIYIDNPLITPSNHNLENDEIFKNERKKVNEIIEKLVNINTLLASSSNKLGNLPFSFRLFKKTKLHKPYLIFKYFYKKEDSYIDINDSPIVIANKIQRIVTSKVIEDNSPY
ncbi:hypothetical protein AB9M62_25600 [Bacillales bacterium AN1005]